VNVELRHDQITERTTLVCSDCGHEFMNDSGPIRAQVLRARTNVHQCKPDDLRREQAEEAAWTLHEFKEDDDGLCLDCGRPESADSHPWQQRSK
jgi:DNA-directed RNA polymerase subunit RPC12/RpoP